MESETGTAVTAYGENAKVTINSGNFKGATAAVASLYRAEVVISGGTFEGPNWTERTADELFVVKYTVGPYHHSGDEFTHWRTHYTINGVRTYPVYGGTFFSEHNGAFIISGNPTVKAPAGGALVKTLYGIALFPSEQRITIRGGTFEGNQIIHGGQNPFLQIYGGTFTTHPSKYCAKDCVASGTADGKYTVTSLAGFEAKIKSGSQEAYYTNLSVALSAVKDGETVTLLKDHSKPVTLSKNSSYTLDLGGKTVSNSITANGGTVTIQNGTVNADSGTALSASGGTLTVTSGTYRGKLSTSGGAFSLIGGKYSADPSDYLLEGSYVEKGSDGLYSIKIRVGTNPSGYMEIKNKEQLLRFAKAVNDGQTDLNAILMNDIDLAGTNWEPICTWANSPYAGTFDGNGYKIQNLSVSVSNSGEFKPQVCAGLFGNVSGVVQNLKIASGSIYGKSYNHAYVGAIVGNLEGGRIVNCSNAASVTGHSLDYGTKVGGIAGGSQYNGGSIQLCSNTGTITATNTVHLRYQNYAGRIAGDQSIDVKNCYNTGTVKADLPGNEDADYARRSMASGIAVNRTVESCYNVGKIFNKAIESKGETQISGAPSDGSTNSYHLYDQKLDGNKTDRTKTTAKFASGEVAYLLNGSKDAPNGPWYQNLTGPNRDPYPVLDPTHPAVYYRDGNYVNATYSSIPDPTITMDGGISLVELVSKLPKTVDVTSTIGTSTAAVTWDTNSINYDPEDFNAQSFQISGTASVTGLLNGGEKPVTATVNVKAVAVTGLTVTTDPNLTYSHGGKLNLGNVKVTAKFSNGAVEILGHDTEGVTFALDGKNIADGTPLVKAYHNNKTLTLSYRGQTVNLGQLVVLSTNNKISALTVSGYEAQYENGGYAVTLPPHSDLPNANNIFVRAALTDVTKKHLSAGDSEAQWQITVRAENGDTADYLLTVTVSPDYEQLNQTAVDEFTAAWNSLTKNWTPTQAQVQQDVKAGTEKVEYKDQLNFWLTSQLLDGGVNIPDNAKVAIDYTNGPNWAVKGSRQDHDGTPGSFTFTLTFTATAGEKSQHKSVSFTDNEGTITPTPYDAPSYTVKFDPQNGSEVSSAQVTEDTPIGNARPADPSRENYRFTGWYTESGMHYVLSNAVMRDLTLIAGWKEAELTGYSVRYLDENGETLLPTETEDGQTTGETVTVTAEPYLDNNGVLWLPETSSATRTLSGNRAENVITFVYRPASEVLLTVRYETRPGETPAFSDSETERIPNTRVPENGLLTADFKDYPGYWPDAYQKSVRPVFDREKNAFVAEIVFLYTANEKHPYTIKHFLEQPDGSYEEQTDDRETKRAPLAARVSGTPNQYANYTYRQEKSRSSITVTGSEALDVIALYYDLGRHTVTYRIRTGDEGKGSLSGTTDYAGIRHGTLFENANAAAPAVQPGRGYKATDWSPAIPAGTTAIERDHVFEIGFERDDAQYHRVIYVANGGVGDDLVDDNNGAGYLAGAETTVWENLFTAPQGKKFTGWDTTPDGSGDAYKETDALVMPDADVTLYAQWKPLDSYTVIYLKNAEDATGTPASQIFSEGDGVDLRENGFTRRGYRFTGWNTAADGSGTAYAPAQPYDTQTDLSLYAQWEMVPEAWHRVLYVANTPEGAVVSGTAPVDGGAYRKDDPVAAAARGDLSTVHYVFTGWNTEADGSGTAYAENAAFGFPYADRDLTLYGMWQRVTFTVTYMLDKGDENGYTEYRKDTVNEGDDYTVAEDAVLEGFVFSGWKLDRTDGAVTEKLPNVTEDHILYGDFTAAERKLTIRYRLTDAASKTWMTLGQPMTVAPGTRLDALLAAAESTVLNDNPGYTKLRGWNGDEAFTTAAELMPDADFTVYAEFERITAGYTIHHVELGSGRTLTDDTTGSALFGATVVTVTAKKAIDGYVYHSDTGNILIAAEPEKNVATIYYTTAAAQTGELTIQKTVTGEKGDKTKAFTFTVTFDATVVYGNQESTSFSFRLKHGERVTIPNIPDGTHYTVKESDNAGYRVSTSGAQGTIRAGESVTAAFLNSRGPVPLTGDSGAKTLGAILMGGSFLAILVLVFIVRRRRKRS